MYSNAQPSFICACGDYSLLRSQNKNQLMELTLYNAQEIIKQSFWGKKKMVKFSNLQQS